MLARVFPTLNLYSLSLLILVLQGYFFAFLLFRRYREKKQQRDLLLALFLVLQGFTCTAYIIGFMDWYDTYRTTKINYFLFDVSFVLGPVLYFYTRSLTESGFQLQKKNLWHLVPGLVVLAYQVFIFIYDAMQPGFDQVQNGVWLEQVHFRYVAPFQHELGRLSQVLYLAFSIQLYLQYRQQIQHFFSDIYQVELRWIRNFLVVYTALFVVGGIFEIINRDITELHWQENWWSRLAIAAVMLYIGVYGYITDWSRLVDIRFPRAIRTASGASDEEASEIVGRWKDPLMQVMTSEKPYLNPNLTIADLAQQLGTSTNVLSQVINAGFDQNFNEFVNAYRVEAVKQHLQDGLPQQYSLLGIAQECGFNSKATFNRTFKKFAHKTPSEYMDTHRQK